ncbi:hypothetical protein BP00DRAFT_426822 [Aspergillus indologenus CBS 114.80]|uniref:Uncharacterized protein n=1 Tax=Aspergillus indologenus CBS 114.80 TaxID=1450541 RepID=A0A2V5J717_9EURO|nr:hypothetical protein BP00DRAFT_426822 [Aspergillus indologenus CBS 114.80]
MPPSISRTRSHSQSTLDSPSSRQTRTPTLELDTYRQTNGETPPILPARTAEPSPANQLSPFYPPFPYMPL